MNLWPEISLVLVAYLVGSIPFGYILTKKFTGKSILGLGSGNIGSTNVGRIAGKKIAALTQLLDMLKGFLPVAPRIARGLRLTTHTNCRIPARLPVRLPPAKGNKFFRHCCFPCR